MLKVLEKSHENGIKVIGYESKYRAAPQIWKNKINHCGYNGIYCIGEYCQPDILGNYLEYNRKSGIKLNENAQATIG